MAAADRLRNRSARPWIVQADEHPAMGILRAGVWAAAVSWWIGDTLGVLLVLPLMLMTPREPRALSRSRAGPVALPMILFFALFVAIHIHFSRWEREDILLEFRLFSQEIADKDRHWA